MRIVPHTCKFSLQSVLANELKQLDMLQHLSFINISKLLPPYLVAFQRSPKRKVVIDRSVVQILQLLVLLIAPLIDWQQTFRCGLILFTLCNHHKDAINIIAFVGANETSPCSTAGVSRVTASLGQY
jgi:hypothetical protein